MNPILRIFESEEQARNAASALVEAGFAEEGVLLLTPTPAPRPGALRALADEGRLAGRYVAQGQRSLEAGRSLVSVRAPFGRAQRAQDVLGRFGPVDLELVPPYRSPDPAPLSQLLGIPTLTRGGWRPFGVLARHDFTLSSVFGLRLLSRNPTPLSSRFGLKTLTTRKGDRRSSFGLPLLSRNPAPLSSMLGMKTLSSRQRSRTELSRNPAPFSDFLGIAVLKKRKKKDRDR